MKRVAVIAGVLLLAARAALAQSAVPEVPPAIEQVVSGGSWETESQRGRYRAVVENHGFEHVASRLWIEWLLESTDRAPDRVIARVSVSEVNGFSVLVDTSPAVFSGGFLTVKGTHSVSLEERTFRLEILDVGKYRLVPP